MAHTQQLKNTINEIDFVEVRIEHLEQNESLLQ